nr:MAG TPA: hypothetical protein [Caudoviricetes sp.]
MYNYLLAPFFSFNYPHIWLKLYFYFPFNLLPLSP